MTLEYWNIVITAIAFLLALLIALYSWRHVRSLAVGVMIWFMVGAALSSRGFFQNASGWTDGDVVSFFIFGTLMFLPIIGMALGWMRSRRLRDFLKLIPLPLLIGVEIYRVAGVIFWWMYLQGMMPPEIGIVTGFTDVFIGLTSLPIAWAVARGIRGAWRIAIAWNVLGIIDFVVAVSMVSLSIFGLVTLTPDPVRIGFHPLALIALFQVPLSSIIHALALRKLIFEQRTLAWQPS